MRVNGASAIGGFEAQMQHDKYAELERLVDMCTDDQQKFFRGLFPAGVPSDQIKQAIHICERTLERDGKL